MDKKRAILITGDSSGERILKTVITPADDYTRDEYSPLLGRLGIFIPYPLRNGVKGFFLAANKNEVEIINPLISNTVIEDYELPTNLYIDFKSNNYVCVDCSNFLTFKTGITQKDIQIKNSGCYWVNLGIDDSVFLNIYYKIPYQQYWFRIRDMLTNFPNGFSWSNLGELAIFDREPTIDFLANRDATRATAFYRHAGLKQRGSVSQIGENENPVGFLCVDRNSQSKNAYIRFNPADIIPNVLHLQVLLELNLQLSN